MKRKVGNEEYRAAYEHPSNRRIMHRASSPFAQALDEHELQSACMDALWYVLGSHDATYGQQFSTSLYRFIRNYCLNALAAKKTRKHTVIVALGDMEPEDRPEHTPVNEEESRCIRECMEQFLSRSDCELIRAIHFEGYTAEEAGKLLGLSKETARQRVTHAVGRLKELCLQEVGRTL